MRRIWRPRNARPTLLSWAAFGKRLQEISKPYKAA